MSNQIDTGYQHLLKRLEEDRKYKARFQGPGGPQFEFAAAEAWLKILYKAAKAKPTATQAPLPEGTKQ